VERDERESGERMLLNFGHPLGHALEKLYNYSRLSHGEAVGIGMVLITRASEHAGLTEPGAAKEFVRALQKYNIPISDPSDLSQIAEAAELDKKSAGKAINLVLLKRIGEGFVHKMPHADLYDFISGGNL
jgi:3-dehydroquinate synthase